MQQATEMVKHGRLLFSPFNDNDRVGIVQLDSIMNGYLTSATRVLSWSQYANVIIGFDQTVAKIKAALTLIAGIASQMALIFK